MKNKYYFAIVGSTKIVSSSLQDLRLQVKNLVETDHGCWENVRIYSVLNGKLKRIPR